MKNKQTGPTPETPPPVPSSVMREKSKYYFDLNEFESALRTRDDRGAIYTNEIIMGWLKDTYRVAFNDALEAAGLTLTAETLPAETKTKNDLGET